MGIDGMLICPSCGGSSSPVAQFCGHCGQPIRAEPRLTSEGEGDPSAGHEVSTGPVSREGMAHAAGNPPGGLRVPARTKPPTWKVLPFAIGTVAVAYVGWTLIGGARGQGGGASSADAAVGELAAAVSDEDPVGALRMIAPGEIRSLEQLYGAVADRGESAGLLRAGDPFQGIDLAVSVSGLEVEELGPDVAKVVLSGGQADLSFDPGQLSDRLQVAVEGGGDSRDPAQRSERLDVSTNLMDLELDEPFVVTVRQGGRWYVSPAYTAMEHWRQQNDLPPGQFGNDLQHPEGGSESPEDAIREFVAAVGDYDIDALFALLPPDELGVLQDYRPAIDEALNRDGTLLQLQNDIQLDVADIEVEELSAVGDTARVAVHSASGSVRWWDGVDGVQHNATWSLDGTCLQYRDDYDAASDGGCIGDFEWMLAPLGSGALASLGGEAHVVTVSHDDRWYVSPMATFLSYAETLLGQLDDDEVLGTFGLEQFADPTGALVLGESVEGTLADTFDYDVYTFEGRADQFFAVCHRSNEEYRAFRLVGPDMRSIPNAAGGFYRLASDGEHRVVISRNHADGERYELEVVPVDTQSVQVPAFVEPEGDLGPTCGGRLVSFQVSDREVVFASIEDEGGAYPASVVGPDGLFVAAPDGTIPFGTIAEAGTYQAFIPSGRGLVLEMAPPGALVAGTETSGAVGPNNSASYEVFAQAGQQLYLRAESDQLDTTMTLLGPDGSSLGYSDDADGRNPVIELSAPTTGIYRVLVAGYAGAGGPFQLLVR